MKNLYYQASYNIGTLRLAIEILVIMRFMLVSTVGAVYQ